MKLLIDRDATGKNIKDALFAWLKLAIEEDMVTIYFAGHGSPESPDAPDNLFLLPYDTQYDNIAVTGFPIWDIETALKRFIKVVAGSGNLPLIQAVGFENPTAHKNLSACFSGSKKENSYTI